MSVNVPDIRGLRAGRKTGGRTRASAAPSYKAKVAVGRVTDWGTRPYIEPLPAGRPLDGKKDAR